MNVSLQHTDEAQALLIVKMEKADYEQRAERALRQVRQKVQMPGFRVGKVPMSIVKKMYGTGVTADEVNKLLGETVYNYLKDNNVDILGEPMPNEEKQQQIDFDTQDELEFVFDLAITPKLTVELTKDDTLTEYVVDVNDEVVNARIDEIARQNGHYEDIDTYQEKALVRATLTELDADGQPVDGGIKVEEASLMPTYMHDEAQKALFTGAKVGDTVTFNPAQAYGENGKAEVAALLHIERDAANSLQSNFACTLTSISSYVPSAVDEELFKKVYPAGNVTTEADFRAKIAEQTAATLKLDTDYLFTRDMRRALVDKVGEVKLADTLLRRFLDKKAAEKNEQPMTDDDYKKSREALVWDLIKNQLATQEGVKVDEQGLVAAAENFARTQFARYGMANVPEEMITRYAKEMIDKGDMTNQLLEHALDDKLTLVVRQKVTVETKTVSEEELAGLFK